MPISREHILTQLVSSKNTGFTLYVSIIFFINLVGHTYYKDTSILCTIKEQEKLLIM